MKDLVRALIFVVVVVKMGPGIERQQHAPWQNAQRALFSVPREILKSEMTRTWKGPTMHTNSSFCPF
jgi:tRNA nucleotidyltransferase/poly(A) polymerase